MMSTTGAVKRKIKGKMNQVKGEVNQQRGKGLKGGMQKLQGKIEETFADAEIDAQSKRDVRED